MKRIILILVVAFNAMVAVCQGEWDSWDQRYQEIDVKDMILFEESYADSVNKGLIAGNYYVRMSAYRFQATYTGEKRKIPANVKSSIIRVYKITGDPSHLPILKKEKNEYKFMVDGKAYWFPVQKVLEKTMKNELVNGNTVILYCLFLNEHTDDRILYNHFLISEFRKVD